MQTPQFQPPSSTAPVASIRSPRPQGVLAGAMLLASLGTSSAHVALPSLAEAWAAPFGQVQAVVVAYLASLTLAAVWAGRLGDHHGLKPVLMLGLVVFALAALVGGMAPTLGVLIGARAVQGLGAACLMSLPMALMRQSVAPAQLGRAMGLLGSMSALGTALGPLLGGLGVAWVGWRGVFWGQAPLAGIVLLLVYRALPGEVPTAPSQPSPWRTVLNRRLLLGLGVNLLVAAVMMTTLVVGPFYLSLGLGLDAPRVGLVMAVGPVISIISGIPAGRLVDAWGSRRVVLGGLGLMVLGAGLLAGLPPVLGVLGYGLALGVLTPGYQLFQAANNTATLAPIPKAQQGAVSGLLGLSRNLGLMTGAAGMGWVFAWQMGSGALAEALPEALEAGLQGCFGLAAGLLLVALLAMAARGRNAEPR